VAGRCFPLAPISEAWRLESTPQPRPGVRQLADVSCRGSSGRAGRGGPGRRGCRSRRSSLLHLSPIEEERVSEAAGVNSAGGSFGLAFAGAIMLVSLSLVFTHMAVDQPADVKADIIHINTKARPRALQIALLVPLVAALLGLLNGIRMTRLPDPEPSAVAEGMLLG
jgi:hypothetical protein